MEEHYKEQSIPIWLGGPHWQERTLSVSRLFYTTNDLGEQKNLGVFQAPMICKWGVVCVGPQLWWWIGLGCDDIHVCI
jgi:hypothetical protein